MHSSPSVSDGSTAEPPSSWPGLSPPRRFPSPAILRVFHRLLGCCVPIVCPSVYPPRKRLHSHGAARSGRKGLWGFNTPLTHLAVVHQHAEPLNPALLHALATGRWSSCSSHARRLTTIVA